MLLAGSRASAQRATAVANLELDLNADGKSDELRIVEVGTISVLITGAPKAGAWTPLAGMGKVISGKLQARPRLGGALIVASATLRLKSGRERVEGAILEWSPGKLSPLWRGPLPAGRDAEAPTSLSLMEDGTILRYRSRFGAFRCDRKTAYLDPESFDPSRGEFWPTGQEPRVRPTPPLLAPQASPLEAAESPAVRFFLARGASSSHLARSAAELVAPLASAMATRRACGSRAGLTLAPESS